MIYIRKSSERGHADHGWLNAKHTFSFADYYDPNFMGFGPLRVINEDKVQGGKGFSTHGHKEMEIITYIIEGALEHRDSMGNQAVIRPGEVQRMSAGTGVRHSEHNHETEKTTHLLQIWILPALAGVKPSYEQRSFNEQFPENDLLLVASQTGRENSVSLNQDVDMYAARPKKAGSKMLRTKPERHVWLQAIRGNLRVLDQPITAGDGVALAEISEIKIEWTKDSEFILFDMV